MNMKQHEHNSNDDSTKRLLRSLNCVTGATGSERSDDPPASTIEAEKSSHLDRKSATAQTPESAKPVQPLDPVVQANLRALTLIHAHPGLSKTLLGQLLGLNHAKTSSLIERLLQSHLITVREYPAGRGGKLRVPMLTPAGYRLIGIVNEGGQSNGGEAHIVVGRCVRKVCEQAGYHVTPEHTLAPEYGVRLDLMCRHKTKGTSLAINICIDNDAVYEAQAAYRALQCEEVRVGRFCFVARDKGKTDGFKKTIRQLDRSLLKHIDFRLAGAVLREANS